MQIGKKLRVLRTERGLTQEKLADLLKIPQATYSNLENDKGKIDLRLIEKVATVLEVDVFELLREDGFTFYNQKNKGGNNGLIINQLSEKLIEQYEGRIADLKKENADLKAMLKKQ